jgi:cytochrome c oxidase subunit IV
MNSVTTPTAHHKLVYTMLVILALLSVGMGFLHLPAIVNNVAIFTIAFAMAALVVAHYMGLRWEGPIILWTFLVPIILFAILVVLLVPDIAHSPLPFLGEH